ncbi:Histidine kinase [Plasmodiophora brassicae]
MALWTRLRRRHRQAGGNLLSTSDTTQPAPPDFRLVFGAFPTICLLVDVPHLRIVEASNAYLQATLSRREDLLGRSILDVLPDDPDNPSASMRRNMHCSLGAAQTIRGPHSLAVQKVDIRKPDGSVETRYWSPLNSPVIDPVTDEIIYIIVRAEDVTEVVVTRERAARVEEENRRRREDDERLGGLEDVIQSAKNVQLQSQMMNRLYGDVVVARDKAVEASNAKSAFVATISHELRTPLSGIIGFNDLLGATSLSSDQAALVTMIGESARILLALVNDILDVSKLEAGKMVLESIPFNLRHVVQNCERLLHEQAERKGLLLRAVVDSDVPDLVRGDPNRFLQIMMNLTNNAIKFTSAGGVTLHVGRAIEPAGTDGMSEDARGNVVRARFEVIDTGIGIAESNMGRLFQPFSQVDSSDTRKFGGTGLGLHIVRTLVELMKGQIGVQSAVGQGSVFWFVIPLEVVDELEEEVVESEGSELCRAKSSAAGSDVAIAEKVILVVDDNSMIRQLVTRQLSNLGYRNVLLACDGREAIKKFETSGPIDIILMDCMMPELDGRDAAKALREIESRYRRPPYVPIVAMTASAMHGDREACLLAGMNDCLTKPFTLKELAAMLHKWL